MKKILLIIIVFIIAIAGGLYFYMYQNHRDIGAEEASFSLTVKSLEAEFAANDAQANQKYLDKTIEVKGKISSFDAVEKAIVLDEKMFATYATQPVKAPVVGQEVKIKGRFIGYDDLLGEFKMDQITLIE
ncbi:hypothetical protein G4D82_08545 [Flavobacterium sp. CYK-4]|uniref:OB-fold protein n=1 Tax=Flavobacterium lotistagni TaxID=2709660 RepID=UPI00140BA348|nr:hypothetical protein [Flavobacterium lotistagni]NHM07266.1 hypothetical protein [Flavobacterium lotistagni]